MTTRLRGPVAGFDWLGNGIGAGFRHPKPLFGGAGLIFLVVLIPIAIMLVVQFHALHAGVPTQPTYFLWSTIAQLLVALLILPLYAGYLQIVEAVEQEQEARASDVFKLYTSGKALRVLGYGIIAMVIYVALLAILLTTEGSGVAHWYAQALTAQANHQPPPMTGLPGGFFTTLLLLLVIAIFMQGFYSISLGQIALGNRSVFGAIGDGIVGTLKNLLPLTILMLGVLITAIIVAICVAIAFMLLALIGKLIGPWVPLALIVVVYIGMFVVAMSAMFGVMYQVWLDVCGNGVETGTTEPLIA